MFVRSGAGDRIMKAARISAALSLMAALSLDRAFAQELPRTPQIEIQTNEPITNIQTAGDGWGGVIRKVQELRKIPRDRDSEIISALSGNLDNLPPPFAYEVVRRTCSTDPQRASHLFALASGRIRYDAYRCKDATASAGVQATMFALQMPECRSMLSDNELFFSSMRRIKDAEEMFSSKASPWWICSHGMAAIGSGLQKKALAVADWLKPEQEWPAIKARIRAEIDYTLDKHSKK